MSRGGRFGRGREDVVPARAGDDFAEEGRELEAGDWKALVWYL